MSWENKVLLFFLPHNDKEKTKHTKKKFRINNMLFNDGVEEAKHFPTKVMKTMFNDG